MKKRILSMLLVVMLLAGLIPTAAMGLDIPTGNRAITEILQSPEA